MLVIWNPNAGSVEAAEPIRQTLASRPKTEVRVTDSNVDAIRMVAAAVDNGEDQIVAAGGDGTINAVINGIMAAKNNDARKKVVLGVLPLGTANDWCASLAVPDDPRAALELIDRRHAIPIDIVEVETPSEKKYFANIATGGNSHRVTESVTSEMKQTWGPLCYLRGAIEVLSDLDTFRARISFDGGPAETFDVWNIIVANGRSTGGRLVVAPKARLDDGLLDVVIVREGTLLESAGTTVKLLTSEDQFLESDQIEYRQARTISIDSDPPLLFSIDGDLVEQQPIRFTVLHRVLQVVVGDKITG